MAPRSTLRYASRYARIAVAVWRGRARTCLPTARCRAPSRRTPRYSIGSPLAVSVCQPSLGCGRRAIGWPNGDCLGAERRNDWDVVGRLVLVTLLNVHPNLVAALLEG